jgi:predicted HTH transcriptional regulator
MRFTFNYTDKIVNNLLKIEVLRSNIERIDFSTDTKYKLTLNTKINELFFIANSLGLDYSLKDAEKVITGICPENENDKRIQLLFNFKSIIEFNRSNFIDIHGEPDLDLLKKLNQLICENIFNILEAKIREGNDSLVTKYDNWIILRDKDITNEHVTDEMEELIMWNKDNSPYVNGLIRYLILIFNLIDIAPFVAANKFTILALADLLFYKYGLSTKIFTSTNLCFLLNEDKVIQTFAIAKTNQDCSLWVQEVLNLIIKSLQKTQEELQLYIMEEEKSKKQPFLDLNKRQLKILRYLQNVPNIKREDYCHMMEVSSMTAFRDLDDLVRKKLIKVEGKGRGTKYRLASL